MIKTLGIDPGTSLIGYGIVELKDGFLSCSKYGVFRTPKNMPAGERAILVFNFFSSLAKKEGVEKAALEKVFFSRNVSTAIAVSEIRGVIVLALSRNGIPIYEFTPTQIKQSVSSYGKAGKSQIQQMVKLILSLPEIPKPDDIADALAVAICGANSADFGIPRGS